MTLKRPSSIGRHINQLVFYGLLVALVGLAAWLSTRTVQVADITYGQRNTLTQPTQQLLKSINEPLNFVAYLSDDKVKLHAGMKFNFVIR